ncbi:hypothetical protein [Paenibacillus crassostreae]|uniref:Uncharacterized protein n=1 Tax=Paenibacillus crassostreae TaxID=1763538 RepID=A0A167GKJ8_9BACL|nr:hypothetical protein [Paenibacillus crassostreae]AOZ92196.1 hypothetical protein LPB68_08120 [Paenibacillus crassostreae]OAB77658.1 hypothetical protein PNBC_01200 [Paenibacillus crassostreae]
MFGKWYTDQRGSVTIFLILILAIMFSFVAIFIDYARIAAVKVQSERLVRSAVRSVMSAYDPELQQEYGLFAYGESDGDQIMSGVLNGNIDHGDRGDAFSLVDLELDTSTLQMNRMLGEYEIFDRQISEEMKYKAPIDFTIEIMNKFKPLSQSLKEASNTMDVLRKLQKLYDKREDALNEMIENQRKAAQSVNPLVSLIMAESSTYISNQSLGGGISSGADIAAQYDDYVAKANELEQKIAEKQSRENNKDNDDDAIDSEINMLTSLINSYHSGASELLSNISSKQSSSKKEHTNMLPKALELWEEAYQYNEEMKQVIAESESRVIDESYDHVSKEGNSESTDFSNDDSEAIRKIREESQQLIHTEDLFQDLKTSIENQTSQFETINSKVSSMQSVLNGAFGKSANSSSMKSAVIQSRKVIDKYMKNYVESGSENVLYEAMSELEKGRSFDKQRKETEKKAKAKLQDATKILATINRLDEKAQDYLEEYRTIQQYYGDSITFNKQSEGDSTKGAELDSNPYDASKSAMDDVDNLYGSMSGMLSGMQNEFYQNEYASLYFHHFDITQLGDLVSNPNGSIGDDLVDQLSVHNQELEYILYGFHNPVGNVSAAYAEIFGVRLAIRTMEGLVKSSKLGNPLLILATGLLYGIEMAILDMIQLCQKGSIELSAYLKVEMTYRDYLRMFLFIHSNNERKMSRMLSLIRFNTGINPNERATYASGEVKIGMNIWFLPGVMRMLGTTANSEDQVEGNRYYAIKKADYSY